MGGSGGWGTYGPTHVPGANEDGDHVWFRLLRMFILHLLEKLAEAFSLLGIEGQTDSERPLPPCTLHSQRAWSASRKLRAAQISTNLQERNLERGSEVLRKRLLFDLATPLQGSEPKNHQKPHKGPTIFMGTVACTLIPKKLETTLMSSPRKQVNNRSTGQPRATMLLGS